MRASQINGCNACVAYGIKSAESSGLSTEQLLALPAWRESAAFDDAKRAALALTEAMTRLADHPDVVTDEIWAEAAERYDEPGLSALVSMAALTNFLNRVNTTLRVQPDSWGVARSLRTPSPQAEDRGRKSAGAGAGGMTHVVRHPAVLPSRPAPHPAGHRPNQSAPTAFVLRRASRVRWPPPRNARKARTPRRQARGQGRAGSSSPH
jgi:AhpD family alkylhydroperoxidase